MSSNSTRVPADIVDRVKGTRLLLPLDGSFVAVKASDKVFFSLRTKDAVLAKARHATALNALMPELAAPKTPGVS